LFNLNFNYNFNQTYINIKSTSTNTIFYKIFFFKIITRKTTTTLNIFLNKAYVAGNVQAAIKVYQSSLKSHLVMWQELRCSQTAIYISVWLCLKHRLKLMGPIIIMAEPVVSKKLVIPASAATSTFVIHQHCQ